MLPAARSRAAASGAARVSTQLYAIVAHHDFRQCRPSNRQFIGASVSVRAAVDRSRTAKRVADARTAFGCPRCVFHGSSSTDQIAIDDPRIPLALRPIRERWQTLMYRLPLDQ